MDRTNYIENGVFCCFEHPRSLKPRPLESGLLAFLGQLHTSFQGVGIVAGDAKMLRIQRISSYIVANIAVSLCLFSLMIPAVWGQTIISSPHNLSAVSGPGTIKASAESEICIFCHTPHNSKPNSPLWNRDDQGTSYNLYSTTTLDASLNQPDGSSTLCLSCHDGTIALGNVISRPTDIAFAGGITNMPLGNTNLSTNLADDHPVSFAYTVSLSATDGQIKHPSTITPPVELENGKVQCTSCHDPHDNTNGKFLVQTRQNSALCLSCHEKDYWTSSTHQSSSAGWNGSGPNPWFHTPYPSVSENACENCHNPHNAGQDQPLLNYNTDENNCLACHNGNVASTDIQSQFAKISGHNVAGYNLIHDVGEGALSLTQHAECQDCHNPHATNSSTATAPNANGFIRGTKGIDMSGNPVNPIQYQYELCFRCHADSPVKPPARTLRQHDQNNVRLEFNTNNPSFHPVAGPGKNPNVPSLIAPLTESSIIYCTDCHASDGGSSPKGPHGSNFEPILRFRYETADNTQQSFSVYRLCYQCHDEDSIDDDESFGEHKKHIRNADAPCNACHDPHGVSATQGNSTNNSHLINFDLNIVSPNNGVLMFEDLGTFSGRCTLVCHGEVHNARAY